MRTDLRNNYLFYNLLQFLTFVLFITYILYKVSRSWTYFFSAEDYKNVVVLDQSTVRRLKSYENLLGWEHTLQIRNQLIKHNIAMILI
jgi:hypothetical protein